MSNDDMAAAVLECVGGYGNVSGNSLCATRLRISLHDTSKVDRNALHAIKGVLGIANRGPNGIEIVFGPNLVKGVYRSFERLTGLFSDLNIHGAARASRPTGKLQVTITPETPGQPQVRMSMDRPSQEPLAVTDEDTNALLEMLDESTGDTGVLNLPIEPDEGPHLLVVNGPNINMLGIDDADSPDATDYEKLLELCHKSALEAGFATCECYHSNHEGDLIDRIQDALGLVDALVINPGAYAYTSLALLDALRAVRIPTVEVHLGSPEYEEELGKTSYVRKACITAITGKGIEGYREAIMLLAQQLDD